MGKVAFTLAGGDVSQRFAVPALNRQRTHVEARSNVNWNTFGASLDSHAEKSLTIRLILCEFWQQSAIIRSFLSLSIYHFPHC